MSKSATKITEAFDGPVLAILRKYHLVDETGTDIRTVEVKDDPDNQPDNGEADERPVISTPMIDPAVIE
jgi:hypothetical protein